MAKLRHGREKFLYNRVAPFYIKTDLRLTVRFIHISTVEILHINDFLDLGAEGGKRAYFTTRCTSTGRIIRRKTMGIMIKLDKTGAAGALITTQRKVELTLQKITKAGFTKTERGWIGKGNLENHDLRHQINDAYSQILWLQRKVGVVTGVKKDLDSVEAKASELAKFSIALNEAITIALDKAKAA